ncbi:lipopolysaccharide biosynthesis protein [Mycolicibacterium hippocampi]|uniref:lipopolysaccharide biosynthesis protein n=1 Tax=Mycolicibacterium hippocampi TaxID=659824 RepID=UPI0013D541BC|nr:oligosaccharide flippase family protein [Mycolicibacterium hippocampi]
MAAADVTGKAAGFVITPFLANRMGAADFGVLNLYLSVTQILTYVISLGGAGLLAVEYIRNGYTSARRLRAANLRLSLWIMIALLIVSVTVSWQLPSAVPLVSGVLIVAVSYVQALNVCELSYYRGAQAYSWAVTGQFAFAILNVVLTVLAFELDSPTVTNRLLSIALAGGVVQTVYVLELRRKPFESADKATNRSNTSLILRFGLSLFVHQASQWIRTSVDRFFVSAYLGLAAAGVYSVGVTLAMAEAMFFNAITQQLQPFLYRRLLNRDFSGFWRIQIWYALAVVGFTAVYYLLLLLSFRSLFANEYNQAIGLLPALLGGAAAQSIYHVVSLASFYERRGGQISSATASALVVHLGGLGALAALGQVTITNVAFVFFASSVVAMLAMFWLSRRVVNQLRLTRPSPTGQEGPA